MSGLAKAVGDERFALCKTRSMSLAVGAKLVLFPIYRFVCLSGTLAFVLIDQRRRARLAHQLMFSLKAVGVGVGLG